jgi:hypothetical protein
MNAITEQQKENTEPVAPAEKPIDKDDPLRKKGEDESKETPAVESTDAPKEEAA